MKRLLFITLISIALLSSCGSSGNNKQESNQEVTASVSNDNDKSFVKTITYKDFVKNVWDIEANPNEFVFKGKRPCVIDFYATWCGPCKMVAPILEKLAKEYDGKVDFYKVDTDKEQKLSTIMKIQYIPAVFFMKDGTQPESSVGAKDEEFFRTQINAMLGE